MNYSLCRTLKVPGLGILLALWTVVGSAQTSNYAFSFSANAGVPDGNVSGLAIETNLTGLSGFIANVTVSLDISGGYNGDLYGYLRGPSGGFGILLNRAEVTTGQPFGYGDTGFNVVFDDSAGGNNIHFYQSDSYNLNGNGQLSGIWSSDGRAIDPLSSPQLFDTTQPTELLTSFNGTDPNGKWSLYFADVSSGGQKHARQLGVEHRNRARTGNPGCHWDRCCTVHESRTRSPQGRDQM